MPISVHLENLMVRSINATNATFFLPTFDLQILLYLLFEVVTLFFKSGLVFTDC